MVHIKKYTEYRIGIFAREKKENMQQDKKELASWRGNCSFKRSGLHGNI